MAWKDVSFDPYTVWTTPDEKEKIEKALRRPNTLVETCPVCFQEIEYKTWEDFQKHQSRCATEREQKIRKEATEDAMRILSGELKDKIRNEVLEEMKKAKKPGRPKKKEG